MGKEQGLKAAQALLASAACPYISELMVVLMPGTSQVLTERARINHRMVGTEFNATGSSVPSSLYGSSRSPCPGLFVMVGGSAGKLVASKFSADLPDGATVEETSVPVSSQRVRSRRCQRCTSTPLLCSQQPLRVATVRRTPAVSCIMGEGASRPYMGQKRPLEAILH
jgi:hypothetical protein